MAIFFIFLVGVLNLGLGFGVSVVIKRRYEARIVTEPTERAETKPHAEEQSGVDIDATAEEAIEAVEELLTQVGLQPTGNSEADAADEDDASTPQADDGESTQEEAPD